MSRLFENFLGWVLNILTLGLYYVFCLCIQRTMTRSRCLEVEYVSFVQFKKNFDKVDWHYYHEYKNSLFSQTIREDYKNILHAGIFIIGGTGQFLTSFGLLRTNCLIRKHCKQLRRNSHEK